MTLPNLSRIAAAATPGPWIGLVDGDVVAVCTEDGDREVVPWNEGVDQMREDDAALIAAAPEMAALLQECAEAFGYINGPAKLGPNGGMSKANGGSGFPQEIARDLLARLADFDRGLGA